MQKKWVVAISLTTAGVVSIIIGVPTGLLLPRTEEFREDFMDKCEEFKGEGHKDYCQNLLNAFEQAYVGKDECDVPMEAYDPLIRMNNLDHPCNQMILWSGTKDFVNTYTKKNQGCVSLQQTLLGFVLDGKNWCGEENSKDTFIHLCPKNDKNNCMNNPHDSFWRSLSVQFASYACIEVTAMLNGENDAPYDPNSTFALEIRNLGWSVTQLNVVLVNGDESKCNSENVQSLKKKFISRNQNTSNRFNCKEISDHNIKTCEASTSKPCGACLF